MKSYLFTIKEISQYLNMKESTLYSLVERREIPHCQFGKMIRFKLDEVDRWVEGHRREAIDTGKIQKEARQMLVAKKREKGEIDRIFEKTLAVMKREGYTSDHRKPDQIKGNLRKEVDGDGAL